MKRVISALLSVLLLGCLTACSRDDGQSKNGDSRSGTLKVAIGETNTDFDGVSVRILNIAEDEGKTQLNVSWVNKTFYEVVYGESYDIEREQNGKWSSCAINGLNFTAIGYKLGRKATQTKSYTLSNSFDISENGKYRFVTDCSVYDKGRGGESTKCCGRSLLLPAPEIPAEKYKSPLSILTLNISEQTGIAKMWTIPLLRSFALLMD